MRIERRADRLMGAASVDGVIWSELGTLVLPELPPVLFVGATAGRISTGDGDYDAVQADLQLTLEILRGAVFHRGDSTADGVSDVADAISVFGHLFLGEPVAFPCLEAANTDNDAVIDMSDGIYLLNWLFLGGPQPLPPGPPSGPCGHDEETPGSAGDLGCESYDGCEGPAR